LIGPDTVSGSETFTMALMGRKPRVTRIGENTQGVYSDVLELSLPNGWRFGLPSEVYLTAQGPTSRPVGSRRTSACLCSRNPISGALGLTVGGLAVGLLAARASMRLLESLLYGVGPTDPLPFAAVAGVLLAVAVLACGLSLRRALGVGSRGGVASRIARASPDFTCTQVLFWAQEGGARTLPRTNVSGQGQGNRLASSDSTTSGRAVLTLSSLCSCTEKAEEPGLVLLDSGARCTSIVVHHHPISAFRVGRGAVARTSPRRPRRRPRRLGREVRRRSTRAYS
jgi:hypothetical protein